MAIQGPHTAYVEPCNFLLNKSWNFIFDFFERANHALFRGYRFVGAIPSYYGSSAQIRSERYPDFWPNSGPLKFGVEIHLRIVTELYNEIKLH